ncbi:hypothetical protein CONPUDRAFT_165987 [Coniophora puteana RWD-64-598 SS2]|uniref:Signal peptidase complex catalytic subunit SEC11 n=1 Tax=Coniophora puteana (strain RWD-64-598) TaxID=741705 RepID=A0A5M3MN70_CONPW|nr:uncharacterized protein CONPUDRAFT_165987 [Coniophora puteana RWD-64-598 SS2]EIW80476.1 hypothetical protein CONPUDRAFT_165987 [Coniophora puteana RWD-64-598 SS2]
MFSDELKALRKRGVRHILLQALAFASAITSVLVIYTGLRVVLNTKEPIVVVLTGSMEPAFHRGDVLFLTNPDGLRYSTGDIVVYSIPGFDIPIVHRVIETHDLPQSALSDPRASTTPVDSQLLLTKGDDNSADDVALYDGLEWLERKHIVGKVRGFLPYVGYVTVALNNFPQLKYALLGVLGLVALVRRE